MWVYSTTQGLLLVSCYLYEGCSNIVDIHKWICIYGFVPYSLIQVSGTINDLSEPQERSYLGLDKGSFIT